ncbi:XRE family transcriptional regulator [Vibrio coralliilyticus]|uniref:XRE family transcriptional regulator n=1 Tax=Vibrio coralliilyticus TaxID=190893 RepID=UPI0017F2DFA9|nr:helix-turn-helix transcriptional regulator [Vibrio coralliilyticus]NUW66924.1 helix-turn-helix transcriptional regulator [Vibrio coralliilyticus]NUW70894.1 helix-turn-helix transcriptional regulator [Vibrio coralliilyticus]
MNDKNNSTQIGQVVRQLRKEKKLTLPELADHIDGYDSGNLSRFERGVQGISNHKLQAIAHFFGYSVADLYAMTEQGSAKPSPEKNADWLGEIDIFGDEDELDEDEEVEIPFFEEVELSAGSGSFTIQQSGERKLKFAKSMLTRCGVSSTYAACVKVSGNSMSPILPDGATVGVDTAHINIKDGEMYAIDHDGMLRIKTLYRVPGGGIRLRSFNKEEYPDEIYTRDSANNIRIIGRIFWYSVLLFKI